MLSMIGPVVKGFVLTNVIIRRQDAINEKKVSGALGHPKQILTSFGFVFFARGGSPLITGVAVAIIMCEWAGVKW